MIVDQDARGPVTTDTQSIFVLLQSDKFEVLGVTTVSGDQRVKQETTRAALARNRGSHRRSAKTPMTPAVRDAIARADTSVARYLTRFFYGDFMWDEIAAVALLDPSVITRSQQLYVDVEVDHGPGYRDTLFWSKTASVPVYERLATVQFELNKSSFYDLYVMLMTQPERQLRLQHVPRN